MVIEESDFRLTPVKDSGDRFDLELLKVINKGKKTERSEFKIVAYGVTIEQAIKHIINNRIIKNNSGVITLQQYLLEYQKNIQNITNLLKV